MEEVQSGRGDSEGEGEEEGGEFALADSSEDQFDLKISMNMKYRTIMRQHVLACFVLQKNASRRRVRRQLGLARGHQQPGGE